MDYLEAAFARDGYVLLEGALPADICARLGDQASFEYERLRGAGWRFEGAGRMAGHLNIRLGDAGRSLYQAFLEAGLLDVAGSLTGWHPHLRQAVGNLNLPGSVFQDFHIDGAHDEVFLIANVCLVPTARHNGATELVPASNSTRLNYWRFARDQWAASAVAPQLRPGDVLLRKSNLWHRGTPNRSPAPRPMAAFVFGGDGQPLVANDCADLSGPLTIFENKYQGRWRTLKEFTAVRFPLVDQALRLGKSLVTEGRGRR